MLEPYSDQIVKVVKVVQRPQLTGPWKSWSTPSQLWARARPASSWHGGGGQQRRHPQRHPSRGERLSGVTETHTGTGGQTDWQTDKHKAYSRSRHGCATHMDGLGHRQRGHRTRSQPLHRLRLHALRPGLCVHGRVCMRRGSRASLSTAPQEDAWPHARAHTPAPRHKHRHKHGTSTRSNAGAASTAVRTSPPAERAALKYWSIPCNSR